MSSSALSLGYGHLKAQKTKCHNKTCAFEQHRSIPTQTAGETVKRSYLLVLHQGLKQFHSKRAADWNRKKWKAWSKKVALQDPASTAENSHRDYLHRCHAGFRSFLSASSNCHPAKRRVLTTQRARKTQCDFGGKFHSHLQRIGNTEKARLLEVDVYLGCFNWRQRRIDCLKMSINLLSSLQTALLRTLSDDTRIHPQTMNSPHMLLTRKLCWLIVMTLSNEKNGATVRQNAPSSNHRCLKAMQLLQWFWTRCQPTPSHRHHPAPRAITTQPLSNCVVRACAYQSARQRNLALQEKILPRLLKTIWQRKDVWKILSQNKSSGTINLVYLPLELLNKTKKLSINKTLSISTLAQICLILQLRRNIPRTTITFIVFCFGNHAVERNASTLTQDLGWYAWATSETYTCYNISIYSETSCGRNADWCSPFGVGAPISVCALSIFLAGGRGFFKQKHRSSFLKALFPNSEDNSLEQGFNILSICLSIYLSVYLSYPILSCLILFYPIYLYLSLH